MKINIKRWMDHLRRLRQTKTTAYRDALAVYCPTCHATAYEPCVDAHDYPLSEVHYARSENFCAWWMRGRGVEADR